MHHRAASKLKKITIYTDGACEGNPGPGGWAAVLRYGSNVKEISGGDPATTNNRMEIRAAIEGIAAVKESCEIELFTDSAYLKNGITEWLKVWKAKGWRTTEKKAVKNEDLWRKLDEVVFRHKVHWKWVKGHAGNVDNERCDVLAVAAVAAMRKQYTPEQLKVLKQQFEATRDLNRDQTKFF